MRPKKTVYYGIMILLSFLMLSSQLYASNMGQSDIGEEVINYGLNLFNWGEIENLQEQLKGDMPQLQDFDLKSEVIGMIKGEKNFSLENILGLGGNFLFQEIKLFIQLGARFVLIVLMCNLLQTLSSSFKSKEITKVGFFVCYLIIIYSVVQSFVVMIQLAQDTIDRMCQVMLVCIPTLLAFMTTTGYATSAAAMAPIMIGALNIISYIVKMIVLPCIISVILLEIVSSMSEEFKVDKFIALFYKGIKWCLRMVLIISIGILGLYRMTLPYVDTTVKKAAVKFTTAFIPVVGNAVGGTVDFLMQCSGLLKNTFATGIVIWLLILASMPLIKILSYTIVYQVAGALIEPIGEKKMASIATKLGKGCQFIMSCVGIVAILCICSLLICMSIGTNVL